MHDPQDVVSIASRAGDVVAVGSKAGGIAMLALVLVRAGVWLMRRFGSDEAFVASIEKYRNALQKDMDDLRVRLAQSEEARRKIEAENLELKMQVMRLEVTGARKERADD